MNKYRVKVFETLVFVQDVEARDEQEADDIVTARFTSGTFEDGERIELTTEVEPLPTKIYLKK